jgi:hypothetical protein
LSPGTICSDSQPRPRWQPPAILVFREPRWRSTRSRGRAAEHEKR